MRTLSRRIATLALTCLFAASLAPSTALAAEKATAPATPEATTTVAEVKTPVVSEVKTPVEPTTPAAPKPEVSEPVVSEPVAPVVPETPEVTTPVEPETPEVTTPVEPETPEVTTPVEPETPAVVEPTTPTTPEVTKPTTPEVTTPVSPTTPTTPEVTKPTTPSTPEVTKPTTPAVDEPATTTTSTTSKTPVAATPAAQSEPATKAQSTTTVTTLATTTSTLGKGTYTYVFASALGNRQVIEAAGGDTKNGANVQSYASNGTAAQQWKIVVGSDGKATIQNVKSGLYLDLAGGKAFNGANIRQLAASGTNAQKWIITWINKDTGVVRISSALNGSYVLDMSGANSANQTNIWLYKNNGTSAQKWALYALGSTQGTISNTVTSIAGSTIVTLNSVSGGKVMGVTSNSLDKGATLSLSSSNGSAGQGFQLQREGNYWRIVNANSGMSLAVTNAKDVVPGAALSQQAGVKGATNQLWAVTKVNGHYVLTSVSTRLTLNASGSALTTARKTSTTAQQWTTSTWKPTLKEGAYVLGTSLNDKYVLEASGGGWWAGINAQLYSSNSTPAQRWYFTKSGSGYTIRNVNSGLYLMNYKGNTLQGTSAAVWTLGFTMGHGYTLTSTGGRLDVTGGEARNQNNVRPWTANGTAAQAWRINPVNIIADGYYVIKSSLDESKVLDVVGASKESGADIRLWSGNGTDAQIWHVTMGSDGYYRISSMASGKVMDVAGGSSASGTNVWQWDNNGTTAQRWKLKMGKTGLVFVSALGNVVLDLAGADTSAGAAVQVWKANNTGAQSWRLAAVDDALSVYIDRFVNNMVSIANDSSHGYDQTYRWGEKGDYDCSSLVITCLKKAGFDTGSASYTGNMKSNLTSRGWTWITSWTPADLQAGDILLNEANHTAAMISTTKLAQASINEKGTATGGQPGDQTGNEINIKAYYNFPWNGILRATSSSVTA